MKLRNTFKSPDPYISNDEMNEVIKSFIVIIGFIVFVILLFYFYPEIANDN